MDPEGVPWYDGRQGRIQRVYHGMMEGRADPEGVPWYDGRQGGSNGCTMVCWKAGEDPEGVQWYTEEQGGRIQNICHDMLEDLGRSRRFTIVCHVRPLKT